MAIDKRTRALYVFSLAFELVVCSGIAASEASGRLSIGVRLPSVVERAQMRNAPVQEPAPSEGWIIYAFAPTSITSEQNSRNVEALAQALPQGWTLLSVTTEAQQAPAFVERLHVTVPVLTRVPAATLAAYRISKTPRTFILDKDWKLLAVLDGAFEGRVAAKLGSRFKVKLPSAHLPSGPSAEIKKWPPGLCMDRQQHPYSPGAVAEILGRKFECKSGGLWLPAS
jgi:hypothetical protein